MRDTLANRIRLEGAVQGVGFRPFVSRLASAHGLNGWVLNTDAGVEVHVEGPPLALTAFERDLEQEAPPSAHVRRLAVEPASPLGLVGFEILSTVSPAAPTVPAPVDRAVCGDCLAELFAPEGRRYLYPYLSCATCGPRYTILRGLPYDRPSTTMASWRLCAECDREYGDPCDRRFHAQPMACPACGPRHWLLRDGVHVSDDDVFRDAAAALRAGEIVGLKSLGGYHLACDANAAETVARLRSRKHRVEKPFALMVRDLDIARLCVHLSPDEETLLESAARPIVLARARRTFEGVAPDHDDFGVMLPYTPAQHLLFFHGAPEVLVMTSGNRSDEPIAYEDADALTRLAGIADAVLVGERPIARRVDDSLARVGPTGPIVLRRGRGYAPGVVAVLPLGTPVLGVGGDLKSTITLAVGGHALTSQHLGDLDHIAAHDAFSSTIDDLLSMYAVDPAALTVAHDLHPQYASTRTARAIPARSHMAIQHHRAHVASVLAERSAYDVTVIGIACDGTGYGDDETIWGGEIFAGSLSAGLVRVAHLRAASLPGGDAAARHPVQAAAGFLAEIDDTFDLREPPFHFPARYDEAVELACRGFRTWRTTSAGRLFDAVAALCGFTRPITYEGQAAMWLEQMARNVPAEPTTPMCYRDGEIDYRETLAALVRARRNGVDPRVIARRFHDALAQGLCNAAESLCESHGTRVVALSGGVFQNMLLLRLLSEGLRNARIEVWTNRLAPPNDGGVSLGQVALAIAGGDQGRSQLGAARP